MFIARFDETKTKVPLAIAVMAVSDTHTLETDKGGALLKSLIEADGHHCVGRTVVRDDVEAIRAQLMAHVADPGCDVVITTGGTGFSARDRVSTNAASPRARRRRGPKGPGMGRRQRRLVMPALQNAQRPSARHTARLRSGQTPISPLVSKLKEEP